MDSVTGSEADAAIGRALDALVAATPSNWDRLVQIFNPTLLAIMCAFLVVAVTPVQRQFFPDDKDSGASLNFLTEAADQLGDTAVQSQLVAIEF